MREIKFRAWDIDQTLREVYSIDWYYSKVSMSHVSGYPHERNLADITLMQYTDLKDRNGREIYEGDIVRMANPYTSKLHGCEVIFAYAQFAIIADDNFIPLGDVTNWEVIGNIYENPELLEAK